VKVAPVITGIEDLVEGAKFRNYPNPFEMNTSVTFSLLRTSVVSLKLYDATGRELPLLLNKSMEEGDHQLETGESLASGIYLCRLIINGTDAGTIKLLKW